MLFGTPGFNVHVPGERLQQPESCRRPSTVPPPPSSRVLTTLRAVVHTLTSAAVQIWHLLAGRSCWASLCWSSMAGTRCGGGGTATFQVGAGWWSCRWPLALPATLHPPVPEQQHLLLGPSSALALHLWTHAALPIPATGPRPAWLLGNLADVLKGQVEAAERWSQRYGALWCFW